MQLLFDLLTVATILRVQALVRAFGNFQSLLLSQVVVNDVKHRSNIVC